jgi:divalent metal cation (Fe/Co/Zn/Cd) transporter
VTSHPALVRVGWSSPLVAFGFDSVIELATTGVLMWRLTVEIGLWQRRHADISMPGLIVGVVAIPAMFALSRAKIHLADRLGSRALRADALEAIACGYLSAVVVGGVTSLAIVDLFVKERLEASSGDDCCAERSIRGER